MAGNEKYWSPSVQVSTGEAPPNACTQGKPQCSLVIYNQSKRNNIGMLIRSAVAFGASELIIVGCPKIRMYGDQGYARLCDNAVHSSNLQYCSTMMFTIERISNICESL